MYGHIALGFALGILSAVVYGRLSGDRRPRSPRPPSVPVAAPHSPSAAGWGAGSATVFLDAVGPKKIAVIKVVRDHTGYGLKETKDLVESAPRIIVTGMEDAAAERLADDLRHAGATATVH